MVPQLALHGMHVHTWPQQSRWGVKPNKKLEKNFIPPIINLKPKHQSIVMRFDYLVKILQISGWGAPRLRDSHFSLEDFCKVHKIWRKYY